MTKFEKDVLDTIYTNKRYREVLKSIVQDKFEESKAELIKNFENHPVTQELSNSESPNISKTLPFYSNYFNEANLFGFLGFHAGSDPVTPVKMFLINSVKILNIDVEKTGRVGQQQTGKVILSYHVPDLDDFNVVAKLEWEGRNWVKGIEKGISGFTRFINVNRGRSKRGVQAKGPVKNPKPKYNRPMTGGFKKKAYMTSLLKKFNNSLSGIRDKL